MIWIIFGTICAGLYGFWLTHDPISLPRTLIKTGATFCLCVAGLSLGAPFVILCGLLFGAIGDAFLSREQSFGFLPGLGAFLCGHLIYLIWAISQIEALQLGTTQIIISAALFSIGVWFIRRWWSRLGSLQIPVLTYAIISICLGLSAIGWIEQGIGFLFATGVFLFVLSDIILAEQLFMLEQDDLKYPIYASLLWALYWVGQLGILLGSLSFVS